MTAAPAIGAAFLSKPLTEEALRDFSRRAEAASAGRLTHEQLDVLTELELDALTELVNLGVSRRPPSLREMVGEQVLLSVPKVDAGEPRTRAIATLAASARPANLVAVHQVFEGDITGRALLIFPETKSLELVRAVTGGDLSLEDIIELEQEALAETGNIILNGCLATIANMLQRNLKMSLPEILRGEPRRLLQSARRRPTRATWCCSSTSTSRSASATSAATSPC